MNFTPVVWTHQGLSSVVNANGQGLKLSITHVSAGDRSYSPDPNQTQLRNEKQKVMVGGGEVLDANQIRLSALFDGDLEFDVREIGFWSNDILVAVHSMPNVSLHFKSARTKWVEVFILNVSVLPEQSVSFEVGINNANLFITPEIARIAHAGMIQGTSIITQAHQQMVLSERLRQAGL
ncbi:phage tail protein [Pseudoalteromonas denitrificans]|uniref:Phage tail-collar fibre protein n=1 Tax=Pseudoalteromonas denitrificans DSM 6059 TaxID=1123010 RepID=A0A1I1PWJ0_9GAMM|nr:phage tail protein [Pseudoalteromonas denitrificans]SFD14209.1 Phage tail-collar fibre protein [Pseudoalteromonas denitrificans DSM 6059]